MSRKQKLLWAIKLLFYGAVIVLPAWGTITLLERGISGAIAVVLIILSLTAVLIVHTTLMYVRRTENNGKLIAKGDITLEELSRIWVDKEQIPVPVQSAESCVELAEEIPPPAEPAPPDPPQTAETAPEPSPEAPKEPEKPRISQPVILKFYREVIMEPEIAGAIDKASLFVMEQLLLLLQQYGDCPSVVESAPGKPGQSEFNNDLKQVKLGESKTVWSVLHEVTLTEHTISVARLTAQRTGKSPSIAGNLIAALAHDIGKIPFYRKQPGYNSPTHPGTSLKILKFVVKGFKDLQRTTAEDVEEAIFRHHLDKTYPPESPVTVLCESDHEARRAEIKARVNAAELASGNPQELPISPTAAHGNGEFPEVEGSNGQNAPDQELDISWFNTAELIAAIGNRINRVDANEFKAVSLIDHTKKGYVYVNGQFFKDRVDEIACAEIGKVHDLINACGSNEEKAALEEKRVKIYNYLAGEISKKARQTKLLAVINRLRKEKAIADQLIKEGYVGGFFSIKFKGGGTKRFFAVPFNVDVFGLSTEELESRKKHELVRNIDSIEVDTTTRRKSSNG